MDVKKYIYNDFLILAILKYFSLCYGKRISLRINILNMSKFTGNWNCLFKTVVKSVIYLHSSFICYKYRYLLRNITQWSYRWSDSIKLFDDVIGEVIRWNASWK